MNSPATTANFWTPNWLQHITGGRWLHEPTDPEQPLTGLGIDSRTLKPGQVFLAVNGDQFDGHDYVEKALKTGAAIAIIEKNTAPEYTGGGVLHVDNTIDALQKLARAYRTSLKQAGCHIIAIVGSNGKTTTRHLIHAVLSSRLQGTQSPKSFNNHLGVPLTILGASLGDDFLVAEVGTNHPGEIDALGEILKPDAAVITCIGKEHMAFFKDLHGVANEEAAITQHLPDQGSVFIEADAYCWVRNSPSFNAKTRVTVYADKDKNKPPDTIQHGRQRLDIDDTTIDLPLIAPHDRLNALAAVRVGQAMGVPMDKIKSALENVAPMPGRLEVKQLGQVTLIDDSYNANPDSTLAALDVLAHYTPTPGGRRIAVLADMLELGDIAESSHREVGQALAKLFDTNKIQRAVLIGPDMSLTRDELIHKSHVDNVTHYQEADGSTFDRIADLIQPNDVVLLKGSRGMQLERFLPILQARFTD